jgi:hypothetical protein
MDFVRRMYNVNILIIEIWAVEKKGFFFSMIFNKVTRSGDNSLYFFVDSEVLHLICFF